MSGLLLDIAVNQLRGFLGGLFKRTQRQILSGGAEIAGRLEAQAKRDAPWTDRTGMARATIAGVNAFDEDEKYYIGVCGNMPYSYQLEKGFYHRYAVLWPTVRKNRHNMLDDIRAVISRQEGLE